MRIYKKILVFAVAAAALFSAGCNKKNNADVAKRVSAAKTESSVRADESRNQIYKGVSAASYSSDTLRIHMIELPVDGEDDESEMSDSSENGFSEDELNKMSELNGYMQELIKSDSFQNAAIDERRDLTESFLHKYENEGLVKKGSIIADNDSVNFQYESGALGGIRLRDFEPYMN